MRKGFAQAALAAALLAGAAPMAHAQPSTEDPGRGGSAAPSGLGPSTITTESGTTVFRGAGTPGGPGSGSGTAGGTTGTTVGSAAGATVFHGTTGAANPGTGPRPSSGAR